MRKSLFWFRIRDSYWFLPTVYGILAVFAVVITTIADLWFIKDITKTIPDLFLTNRDKAVSLYAALITALLTMATISFSSIMVVLTTYSQQFSPRTLQDFMTDRVTQHVLGVYVFGIIYTLINLLLVTKDKNKILISPFMTVVVAIIALGFFVVFIHHSSRWVQVNNLIGKIQGETFRVIQKKFSDENYNVYETWDEKELTNLEENTKYVVQAPQSGYIQHVQFNPLINWATNNGIIITAHFKIGDYIEARTPLFSYQYSNEGGKEINPENGLPYIWIGKERTNVQDIEFAIQKLVEIALRAISPGINDPHTAINCINRIGSLLAELGREYRAFRYYTDGEEQLRVILEPKHYFEYVYKSFYQIRLYGKHDVSVMNGVLEALYKVARVNDEEIKEIIWDFTLYMLKAIKDENYYSYDLELIQNITGHIAKTCGKEQPI